MTTVARLGPDRQRAAAVMAQIVMAQIAVLGVLSATLGLGVVGWIAGLGYAGGLWLLLTLAVRRHAVTTLGPAGLVTCARGVLIGAVTALVAGGLVHGRAPGPHSGRVEVVVLVVLATVALVLDAVDGRVARRTGTSTALGARFDMELDAWLIGVLSVHVAGLLGVWVLAIGGMRYAFVAVASVVPWMRSGVPARNSARVVAALQGVALVTVSAAVLPRPVAITLVAVALAILTWSFSCDVMWLWRAREKGTGRITPALATPASALLVLAELLLPHQLEEFTPGAMARIPVEVLAGAAVLLLLPARARRIAALLGGALLGALSVVAGVTAGFLLSLSRPFHPVNDMGLFDDAAGFVRSSLGPAAEVGAVAVAAIVVIALPVTSSLAVRRLAGLLAEHRTATTRTIAVIAPVWLTCALVGVHFVPGVPVASATASGMARDLAVGVRADLADRATFQRMIGVDAFRNVPADAELGGLRGKDVVVTFIESYGRSAIEDPGLSAQVDRILDDGTRKLAAAGFASRSAFLTSPTSGGGSWLAHSTLLSGLWIDGQPRYHALTSSPRLTLNRIFARAGWRTVGIMPATTLAWPEQPFYSYDQVYDAHHLDYRGPVFSFAPMPDQFSLQAFERLEHGKRGRPPLMAQIVLVSSHAPWSPLPRTVEWGELGDGTVFNSMAGPDFPPSTILTRDPAQVRADYSRSIGYSLASLISYVQTYGDDRLVLVFLGDHQPAPVVVGPNASHDVPVTLVARDPAVLARVEGWGWQDGLRPAPNAPVWPMDAFRDRFLTAFGSQLPGRS